MANIERYGSGASKRTVTIDENKYTEYCWDSFLLDKSGVFNGSKYIYLHELSDSIYPNLYCVKEGTSTANVYETVNGNEELFTVNGSKITEQNYDKFYNLLANTYVWRSGNSNSINEFVKKVNENYDANSLRDTLISVFGYENFVDKNSGRSYDILEVFIKDIQQTVIWDFTTYGANVTRDNIVIYLRNNTNGAINGSNNDTLIQFAKDCYDYIWNSQNTDMSQLKNLNKEPYKLSAESENGIYSRANITKESEGTIIGPVTVDNAGNFNVTYDVVVNGQTYSGDNVKVSDTRSKGSSNSGTNNGQIYLWINTTDIGDESSSITINGNVDFEEVPQVTFLKSNYGQNLVNVVKKKDSKNISTTLKIDSTKEFDLRLTVNIDEVYSKNGIVRESVSELRNSDNQLGYRPMVRAYTLERNNVTTEDYSTNKVPVKVMNGDVVKYKIRISNEGGLDGEATKVVAYIPSGLEMVTAGDLKDVYNIDDSLYNSFNWEQTQHDYSVENGKDYKKCVTSYGEGNTILKYNMAEDNISYLDLYIYCKVKDEVESNRVLQLVAEITEDNVTEEGHEDVLDRDSTPNTEYKNIQGEEHLEGTWRGKSNNTIVTDKNLSIHSDQIYSGKQDDDDFESVVVETFDLALTKTITKVYDNKDSQTYYNRIRSIEKSSLDNGGNNAKYIMDKATLGVRQGSIITYRITVYNEGGIDGYAKEITDHIPKGLAVCDSNGNKVENGEITCTGSNGELYVWNVKTNDDGSQTAVCKGLEDNVIEKYNGKIMDREFVDITCITEGELEENKVYINIAEITKYGYYIDELHFEETSKTGIDRDSEQNTLSDSATYENLKNIVDQNRINVVDKSTYQNQDDDDFESVRIVPSQLDMALRIFISELDGNYDAKMETYLGKEDVKLNNEGSSMESRLNGEPNNRAPQTGEESYLRGIADHKSAEYYHSKQAILTQTNKNIDYTVEIYNEGKYGDLNGIVSEVTINIPKGLTFNGFKNGIKEGEYYYSSSNRAIAYKAQIIKNANGTSKLVVQIPNSIKQMLDAGNIKDTNILDTGNTVNCDNALKELGNNRSHKNLTDILVSDTEKGNIQTFTIDCTVDEDAQGYLTCIAEITDMYAYYDKADADPSTGIVYKYDKDTNTYKNENGVVTERDSTPGNVDLTEEGIPENSEQYQRWYFNRVNTTYVKDSYIANDDSTSPNEEDDTDFETVVVKTPVIVDITKTDEDGNPIEGADITIEYVNEFSRNSEYLDVNKWNTEGASKISTNPALISKLDDSRAVYRITEENAPSNRKNVLKDKIADIIIIYNNGQFNVSTRVTSTATGEVIEDYSDYLKCVPNYVDGILTVDVEIKNPVLEGEYELDIVKTTDSGVVSGMGFDITKNGETTTYQTDEDGCICYSTNIGENTIDKYIISELQTEDGDYIQLAEDLSLEVHTYVKQIEGKEERLDVNKVVLSVNGDESRSVTVKKSDIIPYNPGVSSEVGRSDTIGLENVKLKDGSNTVVGLGLNYKEHMTIIVGIRNPLEDGKYDLFIQKYSPDNKTDLLQNAVFEVNKYLSCSTRNDLSTVTGENCEYNTNKIDELVYDYGRLDNGKSIHHGTLLEHVTYKRASDDNYYDYYFIKETKAPDGYDIPEFFTDKYVDGDNNSYDCYLVIEVHRVPSQGVDELYVGRGYIKDNNVMYCEDAKKVEAGAYKDAVLSYGDNKVIEVFLSDLDTTNDKSAETDAFVRVRVFDPQNKPIKATKVWEVENPNNYQVTFKLQKIVDGVSEDVIDDGNVVQTTLIGNGTVQIDKIPNYDKSAEYKLVEDKQSMKKLVNGEWVPVSEGEFVSNETAGNNKVLADVVEIGDIIAYDASSEGEHTYIASADSTGGSSNVEYKSTDSVEWQVLNVDKSSGTVTLMAANPVDNKLSLNGVTGYKNAKSVLDEISAVYGYGRGAVSARSITLEDIEKYSNFNKTTYSSLSGYAYNSTKNYTSGSFINEDGDIIEATSSNPITAKHTAYWYIAKNYVTRNRAYNALFRNTDNTEHNAYWVNTEQIYLNSGVCGYYMACVNEGNIDGANLYISDGTELAKTFGVVPVVTLKSYIKTSGQDENGNWTLADDELVVNKPITSVSKNKEWVGVENPEHYRATFALYKVVKDNSPKISTVINGENLQLLEDKEAKTVTGNGIVSYSGLNATELVDGKYCNIEYRILEISAEYYNVDTGKWNYLRADTDYSIKDENGTITNTVSIKISLSVTKEWYVGIPSNYRAEYELCTLSGQNNETGEEILTSVDGVDHIFVRGNATESFNNLNKYDENRNIISYRTREVGIQKTTDGGETWETVPMDNYYTTKTEIQATTNRLSDVVSVGDYVSYDATTDGEYTYKAPYSLTGSTEQATFSSLDSMSWRVIDVDKSSGEVYLMSESPTVQKVTLSGKLGYKNEKAVLDNIANVYAHGYGAVSARSITLEDIMQYSNYVKSNYTNVYGYKYGNSVTYNAGRFLDENYNETTASSSNPVTVKQTAYWFVANRFFPNTDIYNALFTDSNNSNNVNYWIASPAVYLNQSVAGFYSNVVKDGLIDGSILYSSEGEEYTKSMATVPVVVLSGNVNTDGQDVRGVWNISGGSVYNEQYINQEKTVVPVEKVWNVDVLENYRATFRLKQTINGEQSYVYVKDEEGNNVLDEGGNPIYRTVQIVGDGEAEFTELPAYIGTTRIQYTPEEILIETTEDNGATWTEVDQSTFIMENNQDYGISTLASSVQVGDYVDYDASTGELISYTTDENITGSSESSTYSSTDSVRWRVLSVDGKAVKLIADKPTETMLALSGKRGYWNATTALNNAASVYGHGIGSVGARSITMADIEEYSTYNRENYINVHDYAYGSDVSYAEGTFLNDDGTEISASHSGEVTMKQSAYWYFTENYFSNKKAYELLFGSNENYKQYWVANTAVYLNTDTAGFYVNEIRDNTVDGAKLFSSDKHFDSHSAQIVPVVYLQANALTTGKDENGVWSLTVSDDYTDTFVNSEKTDVIANKKWLNKDSNYEYRAELTLYAPLELGLSGTNTEDSLELDSNPGIIEIDGVEYAPVAGVNSKYVTGDETVVFDTLKKYKSTTLIDYRVIETKVEYRGLNSEEWIDLEHNGWQELTEDVDYYIDYDGENIVNDLIPKVEVAVTKTWNIDNPDKYKAVIYLLRTMVNTETNEEETDFVYNDNGEKMCITIIGNSTEKFENLPSRVNRRAVTYTVSEPEFGSILAGDLDSQSVNTSISYETDSEGNVSASVVNTWLTSFKGTKHWVLPANESVNDYKVTFSLFVEEENGELTKADGIDDVVVQGNGDVQFTGLPAYNGTERIKYVIKETKAEKYNSENDSWTELAEGKEYSLQGSENKGTEDSM